VSDVATVSTEDLQWSRGGLGNGGGLGGRRQQPASEPKSEPKAAPAADAPKPDTDSSKTEPDKASPSPDASKPADTKPASDVKKFNPTVGKAMTKMGVPPSAVRAIKGSVPSRPRLRHSTIRTAGCV